MRKLLTGAGLALALMVLVAMQVTGTFDLTADMSGTATECITFNVEAMDCDNTDGCDGPQAVIGTHFDFYQAEFDTGATEEHGSFKWQAPKNLTGANGTIQYVWKGDDAACDNDGTADDVCWAVQMGSVGNTEEWADITFAGTVLGVTDRCQVAGKLNFTTETVVVHGLTAGEYSAMTVFRDTDGTNCGGTNWDDLTGDADLFTVRLCYEVNNVFSGE